MATTRCTQTIIFVTLLKILELFNRDVNKFVRATKELCMRYRHQILFLLQLETKTFLSDFIVNVVFTFMEHHLEIEHYVVISTALACPSAKNWFQRLTK